MTLTQEQVREIDKHEPNRSRFIQEAVRRELARYRRAELRASLSTPHPETADLADEDFETWAKELPSETASLVDPKAGTKVSWVRARGWKSVRA